MLYEMIRYLVFVCLQLQYTSEAPSANIEQMNWGHEWIIMSTILVESIIHGLTLTAANCG